MGKWYIYLDGTKNWKMKRDSGDNIEPAVIVECQENGDLYFTDKGRNNITVEDSGESLYSVTQEYWPAFGEDCDINLTCNKSGQYPKLNGEEISKNTDNICKFPILGKTYAYEERLGIYDITFSKEQDYPALRLEIFPNKRVGGWDDCEKLYKNFFEFLIKGSPNNFFPDKTYGSSIYGKGNISYSRRTSSSAFSDCIFFAKYAKEISTAVNNIINIPLKTLGEEEIQEDIDAVSFFDIETYMSMCDSQYLEGPLPTDSDPYGIIKVDTRLYYPAKVLVRKIEETLDNGENRFIIGVLEDFMVKARRCVECIEKNQALAKMVNDAFPSNEGVKTTIEKLPHVMQRITKHPDFRELKRSFLPPHNSNVLLERAGYRELFNIWNSYGGMRGNSDKLFPLLEHRHYHELFEFYICFRLLKILADAAANEKTEQKWYVSPEQNANASEENVSLTNNICFRSDKWLLFFNAEINENGIKTNFPDVTLVDHIFSKYFDEKYIKAVCILNKSQNVRPDYMIFKKNNNDWELAAVLDAKFRRHTKDEIGYLTAEKEIKHRYLDILKDDVKKTIPGILIFIKGDSTEPLRHEYQYKRFIHEKEEPESENKEICYTCYDNINSGDTPKNNFEKLIEDIIIKGGQ